MAPFAEMTQLVKALQRSQEKNEPVTITVMAQATEQLIDTLVNAKYITVKKLRNKTYTLQSESIVRIKIGDNRALKCKKIVEYTLKVLPTVTGTVILSTPRGVITHEEAIQRKTGGKVLVIEY